MENYEYIGDLGSGSYGFVWKCLQRSSGRIVAVKGFKLAHTDKKFLDQAIREVRMLRASCNHPNVVQLLEAFRSSSGRVYMVFEYVDRCLSSELHKRFTCGLPATQTRVVLWQLLCAVAHLHSKKIIHRDIKPGNLLMTSSGVLKLCDFGFARTTRGEPYQPDRFSSYVVTRWYRSPEMLVSDLYSAASDIWSLGCTFAEIATGRPLFPGTSSLDQLWRIMRCLGSLPPSQAERFAAAATAAGLPEPPPPPPRGKSLWQRLPELETRLLDLVQACLKLDPAQRPTAAQLLQMPYFWEIPKLIVGTPLENLYGDNGALNGRPGTAGKSAKQQEVQQQQQQQQLDVDTASATPQGSRGVAIKVMSSEELIKEATSEKEQSALMMSTGDPRNPQRPASVLLSAVAASLLGESPSGPGEPSRVQLLPLLPATGTAPPLPATATVAPPPSTPPGLDASFAVPVTAVSAHRNRGAIKAQTASASLSNKSSGASLSGVAVQPTSPPALLTSPQPPLGARTRSGAGSGILPPLTKPPSSRMKSVTVMPPLVVEQIVQATNADPPTQATPDMGMMGTAVDGEANMESGVAALICGRSSSCEGSTMDRPASRPATGKCLAAANDVAPAMSERGRDLSVTNSGRSAAAPPAVSRSSSSSRMPPSKIELVSPEDKPISPREDGLLVSGGMSSDPRIGFGGAGGTGLGLLPDDAEDVLSENDGHISDDDELMEYFAAKPGATSGGGVTAAGSTRRAMTGPTTLANAAGAEALALANSGRAASIVPASNGAAAAAPGCAVNSSASMRRLTVEALHAGVQGVHHGLYATRQAGNAAGSLIGTMPSNRRLAVMVMRTADIIIGTGGGSGGDAAMVTAGNQLGSPLQQQSAALKPAKRITVGSYLNVPPPPAHPAAAGVLPQEGLADPAAAMRPRTAGFAGVTTTAGGLYRGLGNGVGVGGVGGTVPSLSTLHGGLTLLHTHHGGLPVLHAHLAHHSMTTTTGTGLATTSSVPHPAAHYGRTSVPTGGYAVSGSQLHGLSANVAGSGRQRALSRQGSIAFNQLMYDALPEIGTPGGAPDVPAGTPPRRRVVMSGFTPCRTAAARAAAEGIPPAAAMAAVLGEALQSTTTDLSVAYSPIHENRSIDLLSPDRVSEPQCEIGSVAATGGGGGGGGGGGSGGFGTSAAAVALRRHHRRQAALALLQDPSATMAASVFTGVTTGGMGSAAALAPVSTSTAGCHAYQAVGTNGDAALVLGSSAPTIYHHRLQRPQETTGAAAISSGVAACPVQILGVTAGRTQFVASTAGNAGSIASGSSSLASVSPAHTTPPSGARTFQQTPLTPAARSRLASGNMVRDSQLASGQTARDADGETQSAELDPLGTWAAAGLSPATGGGAMLQLPPSQPQVQQAAPYCRGRLGRWASGLIDSLPEDREVLHVASGDWRVICNAGSMEPGGGGDDAIQMLGADVSVDWVASAVAGGTLSSGGILSSGGGGGGGGGGAIVSPQPHLTLPRGPAGPWPPGNGLRTPRSGSGLDPRVSGAPSTAAETAALHLPSSPSTLTSPPPAGPSRMPSARSRRNLQIAAAAAAAGAAAGTSSALQPPLPTILPTAAMALPNGQILAPNSAIPSPTAGSAAVRTIRRSEPPPAEGLKARDRPTTTTTTTSNDIRIESSSGKSSSGSNSGRWPRAKAFLGGRLISSLVKKFKEQGSEK